MDVPDNLLCLYNAELEEEDGRFIIEIPAREVTTGQIQPGEIYQAVLLQNQSSDPPDQTHERDQASKKDQAVPQPPVTEGEQRTVEIEDLGEQGDGIARVERGYVIIVPDTEPDDRVTIEIGNVRENVAFAEVIERHDHSDQ